MVETVAYVLVSDKDCEIDEYLKNCTCMASLVDDLVMEILMLSQFILLIKKQHVKWVTIFYTLFLLVTICLLLLIIVAIKCYHIKH